MIRFLIALLIIQVAAAIFGIVSTELALAQDDGDLLYFDATGESTWESAPTIQWDNSSSETFIEIRTEDQGTPECRVDIHVWLEHAQAYTGEECSFGEVFYY